MIRTCAGRSARPPEHASSDLYRRGGYRHNSAIVVNELSGEEADVFAASNDAPASHEAAWTGWPQELHVQVSGRGEITWLEPTDQSRPKRVVQHGGQEAALHDSGGVQERVGSSECNFDRSLLRIDRYELPAKCDGR